MARLAGDSNWIMQQIGGEVILFHEYTEEEIVRFDPSNGNAAAIAQGTIHKVGTIKGLTHEELSFAHFWSGYFYRCAVEGN